MFHAFHKKKEKSLKQLSELMLEIGQARRSQGLQKLLEKYSGYAGLFATFFNRLLFKNGTFHIGTTIGDVKRE